MVYSQKEQHTSSVLQYIFSSPLPYVFPSSYSYSPELLSSLIPELSVLNIRDGRPIHSSI